MFSANAKTKFENGTESKTMESFNTSSIHMEGGNPTFHVTNLKELTSDITKKWLASILYKPSILTTKLELVPISSFVVSHRDNIRDTFSIDYEKLFGANLKYMPDSGIFRHGRFRHGHFTIR